MSAYTKGPWFLFSDESGNGHTNIVSLTERTSCVASFPGRHKSEHDLILMAAAPELLEALKECEWSDGGCCPQCAATRGEPHQTKCILGNAIAKAEGR